MNKSSQKYVKMDWQTFINYLNNIEDDNNYNTEYVQTT